MTTRFRCVVCGKFTAGRIPRAQKGDNDAGMRGDTTFRFPRRHRVDGVDCPGNVEEAEWYQGTTKLKSWNED